MAKLHKIEKAGKMDLWDIVKFQIHLYCHLNKVILSESDLDSLTLLALNKSPELTAFCNAACVAEERDRDNILPYTREIFGNPQCVRNAVNKLQHMNLIVKKGKRKKTVSVNPSLKIQSEGNIFIEVKLLRKDEPKEA